MSKPMRIAFDATPLLHKTGVGYYTEQLILHLARQYSNKITLVGFYFDGLGRGHADLPVAPNISYHPIRLPGKLVYQLLRFGWRPTFEFFVREPVDFILFNNFWGYRSKRGSPSAPVVHDVTYIDLPDYVSTKNRQDLARMVPEELERAAFAITVSNFSKQRIVETYGVKPENILVTHIPPSQTRYTAKSATILTKIGVKQPYILFVGTIEPRKNVTSLIAAYRRLPKELQETYQLVLCGGPGWNNDAEIAMIEQAIRDGVAILHTGYVSDEVRNALYQEASLFVSASHYEGFGMPVVEAMSAGIPCALSDIPVFREIGGGAAAYFDSNDTAGMAHTLASILSTPSVQNKMRQASKEQVASLSWSKVATAVFERITASIRDRVN